MGVWRHNLCDKLRLFHRYMMQNIVRVIICAKKVRVIICATSLDFFAFAYDVIIRDGDAMIITKPSLLASAVELFCVMRLWSKFVARNIFAAM
jgi:hypothetical protein